MEWSHQEAEREGDGGEALQGVQGSGNVEAVVEEQNESCSGGELFGNVGCERWQIVNDLEGPAHGAGGAVCTSSASFLFL